MRFLCPVLPLFNVAAAGGLAAAWRLCRRRPATRVLWHLCTGASALACLGIVCVAAAASHYNYPGGVALRRLQADVAADPTVCVTSSASPIWLRLKRQFMQGVLHVCIQQLDQYVSHLHHGDASCQLAQAPRRLHIGVLPAMTGVSRFLEADQGWVYDKVCASFVYVCAQTNDIQSCALLHATASSWRAGRRCCCQLLLTCVCMLQTETSDGRPPAGNTHALSSHADLPG